jgi:hypothetical protein
MPAAVCLTLCTVVEPDEGGPLADEARIRDAKDALDRAQGEIQPVHDAELHLHSGPRSAGFCTSCPPSERRA